MSFTTVMMTTRLMTEKPRDKLVKLTFHTVAVGLIGVTYRHPAGIMPALVTNILVFTIS